MDIPMRLTLTKLLITSLLALLGVAVLVRLGIWQLDRLDQRREFNARVQAQIDQPTLFIDANTLSDSGLLKGLVDMEYRQVVVKGVYDHSNQVVLRNQAWQGHLGVNLLSPLHIQNSDQVLLVERGWVPVQDYNEGSLAQYDEPGSVVVRGVIRRSQSKAEIGQRTDPPVAPSGSRLTAFFLVNVDRIGAEMPYPLLPVYIQQAPDPSWNGPPYRIQSELDLSEGPHLGYAIQWFTFATLLGVGYPVFVYREWKRGSNVMIGKNQTARIGVRHS
jgi:surfeit locus 1 family protein